MKLKIIALCIFVILAFSAIGYADSCCATCGVPSRSWTSGNNGNTDWGAGSNIYTDKNSSQTLFEIKPSSDTVVPIIKVKGSNVHVRINTNFGCVSCITISALAFNGGVIASETRCSPPWDFVLPCANGARNLQIRVNYQDSNFVAFNRPL